MAALLQLCNRALRAIAAGEIAAFSEPSIEAKNANAEAQPLLNEMAEWSDVFAFGQKRVVLAEIDNDRPAEWLYAYAAPSDLGTPVAIRMVEDAASYLPVGGPFTFPDQDRQPLAFLHENATIYSNVETATLIYTKAEIAAADLSPLGQKAFVDELAARLAVPVKKASANDVERLRKQAEVSRARWVAEEENKSPRRETQYISEAEYARAGIGV